MPSQKMIIFLVIGVLFPLSLASAGTIVSPHQYAWSNNVGYINFFGVTVSDSALGGYAWSTNAAFINFSPALGGVFNNGAGNLSGSAWGEQLGWIDFDGVSIDGSTGKFSGTAVGTLIGTLTFDCPNYCDVETDWRQAKSSDNDSGGGRRGDNDGGGSDLAGSGTKLLPVAAQPEASPAEIATPFDGQPASVAAQPALPVGRNILGIFQSNFFLTRGILLLIAALLLFLAYALMKRKKNKNTKK